MNIVIDIKIIAITIIIVKKRILSFIYKNKIIFLIAFLKKIFYLIKT